MSVIYFLDDISTSTNGVHFIGDVRNDQNDSNVQKDNFGFSGKVASTVNTVFGIHYLRPK